jgi:hypothetical protein
MLGGRTAFDLIAARQAGCFINLDMYVRELGKAELGVLFLEPGTVDRVADYRTTPQKTEDEKADREQAEASGLPYWDRAPGLHLATSDPKRLVTWVKQAEKRHPGQNPNLAIEVRDFIVAHARGDKAVEVFKTIYTAATGQLITPTMSLGWDAYFVFQPPGGWEPPDIDAAHFGAGGNRDVEVFWRGRFIPIPPSVMVHRKLGQQGMCHWVGDVPEAPPALLEALAAQARPTASSQLAHPPAPDLTVRPVRPLYPVPPTRDGLRSAFDVIARHGEYDDLEAYVTALGTAGLELTFLQPGAKEPVDLRKCQQKMEDDAYARERARLAGNPRWDREKTSAGIEIATSDPERLAAYARRAKTWYPDDPPNLAMRVRNMLVVDTDWAAGVEFFARIYAEATGTVIGPTVLTPGDQRADGTWRHKDGGHFYFLLPEGWEAPESLSEVKLGEGDEQVSLFVADQYILIPPSIRQGRPYRWVGEVLDAPDVLVDLIAREAARKAAIKAERALRAATFSGSSNGGIDRWAAATDWADLLIPDGWYPTGSTSRCGCPEYTAPGVHASPKSSTAHDPGCEAFPDSTGHGPLHIWTDNPPPGLASYMYEEGKKTMSKLQYVAWMHHDGDEGAACRALGIRSGHLLGGGDEKPSSAMMAQIRSLISGQPAGADA